MSEREHWSIREPKRLRNKSAEQEAKRDGWQASGDVPYILAHGTRIVPGTIRVMSEFLPAVLAEQAPGYEQENVVPAGRTTFLSPDLIEKIAQKAEARFGTALGRPKQKSQTWNEQLE
jgi:hypothetical protein